MSSDTVLIQDAIGEKVGKFLQLVSTFLGGFFNAFARGWLLSLSYTQTRLTRGFGADAKEMCEQASTIASDASSDFMLPFYVGALFVRNGTAEVGQVFQVFFALTMMAVGVFQSSSLARPFTKVQDAAVSIFRIIDRIS
ncbi:ABC transporter B family member 7-like isoform X2 [Lolium perenne]|uniref:ABC transporter B family member 7-like isoform X2 n=1 Tax=Lolium perenne TaxID=4522 RepID=UPI003A9906F0